MVKVIPSPVTSLTPQSIQFDLPNGLNFRDKIIIYADESDPIGLIPELNEKNNRQVFWPEIRVPELSVTLNTPTEFDVYRSADLGHQVFSGNSRQFFNDNTDIVNLAIEVENIGEADAQDIKVCFKITSPANPNCHSLIRDVPSIPRTNRRKYRRYNSLIDDTEGFPNGDLPTSTVTTKCQIIPNLVAGASPTLITEQISFSVIGQHRLDFYIDPDKNITENRRGNNTTFRLIDVINKPTLNISMMSVVKKDEVSSYVVDGDDVNVSMIGVNNSTSNISTLSFGLVHKDPNNITQTYQVLSSLSLSPNESYKATQTLQSLIQGEHTFTSTIDYGSSNTSNLTENICVHPPLPDLAGGIATNGCSNSFD